LVTVGFTGSGECQMASLADYLLAIHSRETARIQEAHILAGHMLCDWIEQSQIATEAAQAPQAR
jgi:D-sedoheptulose 7-phosphate isomerase